MLRPFLRSLCLTAAVMTLSLLVLGHSVFGQKTGERPTVVVTIAPLEQMLKNLSYVLRASGAGEASGMMSGVVNAYTSGVDRSRPAGLAMSIDENNDPVPVVFLPITKLDEFLEPLKLFGEIDNLGDGLYAMSFGPQSVYAKSKEGGWLFVTMKEETLKTLSLDPMTLVGEMSKRYDISVRIDVQSIPANLKNLLIEQMKTGFESSLAEQAKNQSVEERAAAEAMGRQQIEQIEQMIVETREALLGWSVDSANKKTMLDFGVQFMEGTSLEKQTAALQNIKSQYLGFQSIESPAGMRFTSAMSAEDANRALPSLKTAFDNVLVQMKQNGAKEGDLEVAKELLKPFQEVAEATLKEGVIDGGGMLHFEGGLHAVAGARVADGNKLAAGIKQAISKLPNKPSNPKVTFDASKHRDVTFHTGVVPLAPDVNEEAKAVFGNEIRFVIGTGSKSVYVALGKNCESRLKEFPRQERYCND